MTMTTVVQRKVLTPLTAKLRRGMRELRSRWTMRWVESAFWDHIGNEPVSRWVDADGQYWLAVTRWGMRCAVESRQGNGEAAHDAS